MKLIAHRGLWVTIQDANSLQAIEAALSQGMEVETDIRSLERKLFVSHDPITDKRRAPHFRELLQIWKKFPDRTVFLNVKEDGLLPLLIEYKETLRELPAVFFDMSIPQLVQYAGVFSSAQLASRVSDVESYPVLASSCDWIWVDGFQRTLESTEIRSLVSRYPGKKWAFVSHELHGRQPTHFWKFLKDASWLTDDMKLLCTDYPLEVQP